MTSQEGTIGSLSATVDQLSDKLTSVTGQLAAVTSDLEQARSDAGQQGTIIETLRLQLAAEAATHASRLAAVQADWSDRLSGASAEIQGLRETIREKEGVIAGQASAIAGMQANDAAVAALLTRMEEDAVRQRAEDDR